MTKKETKKPDYKNMNIYQKLVEVKKHIKGLSKDGKSGSGSFSYKYITPSKVDNVLNPLLNEIGLYLTKKITNVNRVEYERISKDGKKIIENLYEVNFLMTWVNIDKPEEIIEIPWFASGVNGTEKGLGSSITYASRYFKLSQFDIPSDHDDVDALAHVELAAKEEDELNLEQWIDRNLSKCKTNKDVEVIIKKIEPRRTRLSVKFLTKMDGLFSEKIKSFDSDILLDEVEGFLSSNPSYKSISDFKDNIITRTANEETRKKILSRFLSHENMTIEIV